MRQVIGKAVELDQRGPAFTKLALPGELPFGELAGGGDPGGAQLPEIEAAVEMRPGLAVADAAHRGHLRRERVAAAQAAKLVDQAGIEHRLEALLDARMQYAAVGRSEGDGQYAAGEATPAHGARSWQPAVRR